MKNFSVEVMLLNTGGYSSFKKDTKFPVKVLAKPSGRNLYEVPVSELHKVGYDLSSEFSAKGDTLSFCSGYECVPVEDFYTKVIPTPKPRFRKKRITPPVRKKTDVRISYNNGMRYTITNALSFVLNKEQEDIVSITSLVKGIRTTVELPLNDIQFMKVLTPTGVYDIHNEGYYNTALVVNLTHKMSSACSYLSLSFE